MIWVKGDTLPAHKCYCVGLIDGQIYLMLFEMEFGWSIIDIGCRHAPVPPDFYCVVPSFYHLVR